MTLLLICCFLIFRRVSSDLAHGFAINSNSENDTWKHDLELSPRHRIKDSSYLLDRYPIRELPTDSLNCHRPAKCVEMQRSTCMGTRLSYTTTTLDLIPEHVTQNIIEVYYITHMYYNIYR